MSSQAGSKISPSIQALRDKWTADDRHDEALNAKALIGLAAKLKPGDFVQTSLLRYQVKRIVNNVIPMVFGRLVATFRGSEWRAPLTDVFQEEDLHLGYGDWEIVTPEAEG